MKLTLIDGRPLTLKDVFNFVPANKEESILKSSVQADTEEAGCVEIVECGTVYSTDDDQEIGKIAGFTKDIFDNLVGQAIK